MNKKISFALLGGIFSLGMNVFGMEMNKNSNIDGGVKELIEQPFIREHIWQLRQEDRERLQISKDDLLRLFSSDSTPVPQISNYTELQIVPIELPNMTVQIEVPPFSDVDLPHMEAWRVHLPHQIINDEHMDRSMA